MSGTPISRTSAPIPQADITGPPKIGDGPAPLEEPEYNDEWISINEWYPPYLEDVLVYWNAKTAEPRCGFATAYPSEVTEQWQLSPGGTGHWIDHVTHWRPLPTPPRET